MNEKVNEEQSQRKRVSNQFHQKDNKITVLTDKLKEAQSNDKKTQKLLKEYEEKIKELEVGVKKKGTKKPEPKRDKGPKLFGANEDALIDALYGEPIPPVRSTYQSNNYGNVDEFGHADLPPARPVPQAQPTQQIQQLNAPNNYLINSSKKEESKQVKFNQNVNMHQDSDSSIEGMSYSLHNLLKS
jgi:hypothetical protein